MQKFRLFNYETLIAILSGDNYTRDGGDMIRITEGTTYIGSVFLDENSYIEITAKNGQLVEKLTLLREPSDAR